VVRFSGCAQGLLLWAVEAGARARPAWAQHGGHRRAPVAGMVEAEWASSAGVGVTSVARWLGLMTAETAGSSGAWWTWSGRLLLLSSGSLGRGPGRGEGRRQRDGLGEAGHYLEIRD
jgi:hypothetical protein